LSFAIPFFERSWHVKNEKDEIASNSPTGR
jgi:hypothetical protein